MRRRTPISTRTDTLFPDTTLFRSFAAQFADPTFGDYVRTPEVVEIDHNGARAAETGQWVAHWDGGGMSGRYMAVWRKVTGQWAIERSEEHTSEIQSLMRISYAVFCLKTTII